MFRGNAQIPVEEIRPRGTVVVFPSFLEHCVTPVTEYETIVGGMDRRTEFQMNTIETKIIDNFLQDMTS